MKEVPAFLLITWKHFKNLKVRLGRPPGFDRNIFNLRYGEQYNVLIAVPLNQTVIVLVSPLFLRSQTTTPVVHGFKESEQEKEARESWLGKREGRNPPLCLFVSSSGEEGKKRAQIAKISASKGSRAVAWE